MRSPVGFMDCLFMFGWHKIGTSGRASSKAIGQRPWRIDRRETAGVPQGLIGGSCSITGRIFATIRGWETAPPKHPEIQTPDPGTHVHAGGAGRRLFQTVRSVCCSSG